MSNVSHPLTCPPGADYLKFVSNIVSTNKSKTYKIKSPAGATWTVGDVDDTIYSDDDDAVYAWENFYLRKEVCMQVLGVLEGTAFSGEQPVLMTCEDSKMYVYDGDELHLVASSLEQLCKKGIDYPPSVTYCYGDAFKEMVRRSRSCPRCFDRSV